MLGIKLIFMMLSLLGTLLFFTIAVLKIFVVIQLLTGGGPNNGSVTMMYYLYQNAFVYNNTGVASAIGVLMFIIALLLSMPQLKSFLKTK